MATIALCVICKNEKENFPRFLESVRDCFDEIHVTDTGSTDGTLELLDGYTKENPANTPLFLHHFQWINDFAAARNFSFAPANTDYVCWLDLDDVLQGREEFISWRATCLEAADMWVATYHYGGITENGQSPCKFMRERVVRRGSFHWKYFVHEGLVSRSGVVSSANYVTSWSVVHKRTTEDQNKDRSRNLKMFEGRGDIGPRMQYYYGKELFENQQPMQAYPELMAAIKSPELELHDRIMGIQYACLCAMQCNQIDVAMQLAHQGLQLAPGRAEFHVVIGDCLTKQQKLNEAIPWFAAAASCQRTDGGLHAGHIFTHGDAYDHYPRNQLARCYFHTNRMELAKKTLEDALRIGPNIESAQLFDELTRVSDNTNIRAVTTYRQVKEIAITCLPNVVKDWDEASLQEKGLGGSETAVIHMARALHKLTGLHVRVFNDRKTTSERDGVSYESFVTMYDYFKTNAPLVQIAWRHNVRLSPAPMYVWCHDLAYLGVENGHGYEGILALSEFHKTWLQSLYSVPKEKIILTRNGIDENRYLMGSLVTKNPKKVIYSSSLDRGVDRAIAVMDRVVEKIPDAELHIYYGMEHFTAMGKAPEAERYKAMFASRPYVKYHGNVPQHVLTQEFYSAAVWLYPTNFLETFCITAIEALCAGVYPVVRAHGALNDTLGEAFRQGQSELINDDGTSERGIALYASRVMDAIHTGRWADIDTAYWIEKCGWEKVAAEWVQFLPGLK